MLMPSIFGEDLFDDFFDDFKDMRNVERKLYGRRADHIMKTDVKEQEDRYEVDIDLPGFKKEELSLSFSPSGSLMPETLLFKTARIPASSTALADDSMKK